MFKEKHVPAILGDPLQYCIVQKHLHDLIDRKGSAITFDILIRDITKFIKFDLHAL